MLETIVNFIENLFNEVLGAFGNLSDNLFNEGE